MQAGRIARFILATVFASAVGGIAGGTLVERLNNPGQGQSEICVLTDRDWRPLRRPASCVPRSPEQPPTRSMTGAQGRIARIIPGPPGG